MAMLNNQRVYIYIGRNTFLYVILGKKELETWKQSYCGNTLGYMACSGPLTITNNWANSCNWGYIYISLLYHYKPDIAASRAFNWRTNKTIFGCGASSRAITVVNSPQQVGIWGSYNYSDNQLLVELDPQIWKWCKLQLKKKWEWWW